MTLFGIKQKNDRNPSVVIFQKGLSGFTFRLQGCLSSTCMALGDEEAFVTRQRGEEGQSRSRFSHGGGKKMVKFCTDIRNFKCCQADCDKYNKGETLKAEQRS